MFWQIRWGPENSLGKSVSAAPWLWQAAMKDLFSTFSFIFIITIICFSSSSSFSQSGRKRGSDCSMQKVQWDGVWEER
jgi:hypothetical protein